MLVTLWCFLIQSRVGGSFSYICLVAFLCLQSKTNIQNLEDDIQPQLIKGETWISIVYTYASKPKRTFNFKQIRPKTIRILILWQKTFFFNFFFFFFFINIGMRHTNIKPWTTGWHNITINLPIFLLSISAHCIYNLQGDA